MRGVRPEALAEFLQEDPLVVDVRPAGQAEPIGFAQALSVPLADIQGGNHHLPKDRPILLVCERGVMSELAGLYLEAAGYERVYHLEGGLRGLKRAST
ncbi:Thiosulfate sulfurtransferase GlpE [Meiothermus luteus]|jgi:rhodanese-related sulfurtransferase|uniref:Thiosulfate sulfurtransferase GlpE n=1 Tax=Meiothermus luteus TaxID=2026184 RepID=A0A399ESF8_9DEIN|nr:rhodanese-like domain-containing protein [Meiothermus luteus]RIH87607.1 Thiosulfate sulfurtransferase GlpE [Meiothermus luteus]RMH54001.1 MAG: rhodanese-like domain-containing protein [Deinococcota bacterium]